MLHVTFQIIFVIIHLHFCFLIPQNGIQLYIFFYKIIRILITKFFQDKISCDMAAGLCILCVVCHSLLDLLKVTVHMIQKCRIYHSMCFPVLLIVDHVLLLCHPVALLAESFHIVMILSFRLSKIFPEHDLSCPFCDALFFFRCLRCIILLFCIFYLKINIVMPRCFFILCKMVFLIFSEHIHICKVCIHIIKDLAPA